MIKSFVVYYKQGVIITNHDDEQMRIWKLKNKKLVSEIQDKSCGEALIDLPGCKQIVTARGNDLKIWDVNLNN